MLLAAIEAVIAIVVIVMILTDGNVDATGVGYREVERSGDV